MAAFEDNLIFLEGNSSTSRSHDKVHFTHEEMRTQRQFNRKRVYFRCISVAMTSVGFAVVYTRYTRPDLPWSSALKLMTAGLAGYLIGKFSHRQKCVKCENPCVQEKDDFFFSLDFAMGKGFQKTQSGAETSDERYDPSDTISFDAHKMIDALEKDETSDDPSDTISVVAHEMSEDKKSDNSVEPALDVDALEKDETSDESYDPSDTISVVAHEMIEDNLVEPVLDVDALVKDDFFLEVPSNSTTEEDLKDENRAELHVPLIIPLSEVNEYERDVLDD